jgi:iron(III) transport system permease protein
VGEVVDDPNRLVEGRFVEPLVNSLTVAAIAALVCVATALVVGNAIRLVGGRGVRSAAQVTVFGYAVPGVVVALGVLVAFAALDAAAEGVGIPGGTGLVATGSVVGVVYAYVVRFLAPAYQSVDASLARVSPSMTASALSLGAPPRRVLTRVHLPLMRSGVVVAAVLVVIDAIKELPMVLLLRPIGFTTVSVRVYELASENLWHSAALPALLIVAAATIPVILLMRGIRVPELERPRPYVDESVLP